MPITPQRLSRVQSGGTEWKSETLSSLAAGASTRLDIDSNWGATMLKYAPLDEVEIVNEGAVTLRVYLDERSSFLVPSSTIRTNRDQPFRSIRIKNTSASAALAADVVDVSVRRGPVDADKAARFRYGYDDTGY